MAEPEKKKKKKKMDESTRHLINLIIIIIFLVATGLLWLDYLGLLDFNRDILPIVSKIPGLSSLVSERTEDPYLLAREEEKKLEYLKQIEWDKLKAKEAELENLAMKLEAKEKDLTEQLARLKQKEDDLDKKYAEKTSYRKLVQKQAEYLVSMRPKRAVTNLSNLDDSLIVDLLNEIENQAEITGAQSVVPYYLELMPPERAATIQRKMTVVEEDIRRGTNN